MYSKAVSCAHATHCGISQPHHALCPQARTIEQFVFVHRPVIHKIRGHRVTVLVNVIQTWQKRFSVAIHRVAALHPAAGLLYRLNKAARDRNVCQPAVPSAGKLRDEPAILKHHIKGHVIFPLTAGPCRTAQRTARPAHFRPCGRLAALQALNTYLSRRSNASFTRERGRARFMRI